MKRNSRQGKKETRPKGNRLYTLEVSILSGPMTEEFIKRNPRISRTIQIKGNQTLADLHDAIFDAFGREEEHMYEFQFGKGPHDPNGERYVLRFALEGPFVDPDEAAGDVARTAVATLNLEVGRSFGYWFDFGDDWWHQIDVVAIEEKAPRGKFPKLIESVGESPPQYIDWDEEGEED